MLLKSDRISQLIRNISHIWQPIRARMRRSKQITGDHLDQESGRTRNLGPHKASREQATFPGRLRLTVSRISLNRIIVRINREIKKTENKQIIQRNKETRNECQMRKNLEPIVNIEPGLT